MGIERILTSSERDFVAKSVDYIEVALLFALQGAPVLAEGVHCQIPEPGPQCRDPGEEHHLWLSK